MTQNEKLHMTDAGRTPICFPHRTKGSYLTDVRYWLKLRSYVLSFRNRTRYNNLIGETDPYDYLVKIKEDGYATSSHYVQNVYNVIKRYNLTRFDN